MTDEPLDEPAAAASDTPAKAVERDEAERDAPATAVDERFDAEAVEAAPAPAVDEGLDGDADGAEPAAALDGPVPDSEEDLQPTTDPQALKPILEALIFASPDPLTLKEMAQLLVAEASKAEVEQAVVLLRHDYERPEGGHAGLGRADDL